MVLTFVKAQEGWLGLFTCGVYQLRGLRISVPITEELSALHDRNVKRLKESFYKGRACTVRDKTQQSC